MTLSRIARINQNTTASDAFGRLRVSSPFTIFDSKQVSGKQELFFDEVLAGGATSTHNPGEASVSMAVTNNGDYAIRETFMAFNYQPGKSQLILLTGVLGEPAAGTESRMGYFSTPAASAPYITNRDGVYFGQDGASKYIAISRNGTETKISQADWNVDVMDGIKKLNNPSNIEIDWGTNQIFFIDFEWLGVGIVRFGHIIDGQYYVCHIETHTNRSDIPTGAYMSSPNQPVRYEVRSTGGALTIKHICCSITSEGGTDPSGVTRGFSNLASPIAVGVAPVGVLYLRIDPAQPQAVVKLEEFSILNTVVATNNYIYQIILDPVIAGPALSWGSLSNSAINYAVGVATNTITGGTVLLSDYASGGSPRVNISPKLLIRPGVGIAGSSNIFAVVVRTFSGSDSFVAAMNVREDTNG